MVFPLSIVCLTSGFESVNATEDLRKLRTEYYQRDIETNRASLVDSLIGRLQDAKSKGGGLAGYGGRAREVGEAQSSYASAVEDIYTGLEGDKASALQELYDTWAQFEDIISP